MATIQKRKGRDGKPSYRVQIRLRGHDPESATFERLTDAREWAARIEANMKAGRHFGTAKRHTFDELADAYEADVGKELKSFDDRRRHLDTWRAEFGKHLLSDVTPDRIRKIRNKLLSGETRFKERATGDADRDAQRVKGTRTGPTVNRYLATLSACMSYGVRALGWLEKNPVEQVSKSTENRGRVRFLSEQELPRLLDACRPWPDLYLAVVLSLTTAGRQSEIMGLRWPQIDFARRVITLNQGTTKNKDARALPLSGEAFQLLQERAKVRDLHDDRVFIPVRRGAQNREPREAWTRALAAAGISDFRWHDLRHTAASYLAMSGVSLLEIAKILGHRTLAMVSRYSHLADQHVVEVGDKLAARMNLGGAK